MRLWLGLGKAGSGGGWGWEAPPWPRSSACKLRTQERRLSLERNSPPPPKLDRSYFVLSFTTAYFAFWVSGIPVAQSDTYPGLRILAR